jgi:hypothetical protein
MARFLQVLSYGRDALGCKENELVKSPNETAKYDAQHSPA